MEIIFDYCSQPRAYADSVGKCLIKLDENDNEDEVIKTFTQGKEWYETHYSVDKKLTSYTYGKNKFDSNGKLIKIEVHLEGNLILFNTKRVFLD